MGLSRWSRKVKTCNECYHMSSVENYCRLEKRYVTTKGVPGWCPVQKLSDPVDSIYRMNTEFYVGTEDKNWTG